MPSSRPTAEARRANGRASVVALHSPIRLADAARCPALAAASLKLARPAFPRGPSRFFRGASNGPSASSNPRPDLTTSVLEHVDG